MWERCGIMGKRYRSVRGKELWKNCGSDKKIVGDVMIFGRDKELWEKPESHGRKWRNVVKRYWWERLEHCEKRREKCGRKRLFITWGRLTWLVHLEENKIGPYILNIQIHLRWIKHLNVTK